MPIDLVGALVGWVVSLVGDAGIRLVRSSPDERTLRRALGLAVDRVVEQVDSSSREALRVGLRECFSTGPRMGLDASNSVSEGLRAAIAAQVTQLDQMMHGDTGQLFYQVVGVDREWLGEQVTAAVVSALRQVVAAGGLAELVHGVDAAEVLARLSELRVVAPAAAVRALPRDIGSFTGREDELRLLMRAVNTEAASGGVVGIHAIEGMAGIGKTALAVHAAHQLTPQFPDGQIFLQLHAHTAGQRPVEAAEALAILLLSVGVAASQIPAEGQARELLWRDRLSGKRVLLVLDDASGSEQVSPLLPGTAGSLVVITSRRRLVLDDVVSISLDILPPAEAAVLFLRVATRPSRAPTDAAVAEVTRLCGYLPLAIRLVAGRLLRHPSWTVTHLAAELAAAQDRLEAIEAGQRSVSAAFELSYRDLSTGQRQLFRRLGLQPGVDIDAYVTAALGETTVADARRHLEDLTDLYLLDEPVRGRYRLHDLLRDYARALAATDPPAEREQALDRLLDYYLHTATLAATHLTTRRTPTTSSPLTHRPAWVPELATREAAIAWLEAERANLYAATDHAAQHARQRHVISLPAAMHEFFRAQGPWSQALALHHTALHTARDTGDQHSEATTLTNLGIVQHLTGDYSGSTANLGQALALFRDLGDRLGEATAFANLGLVQNMTDDYPGATANLRQALALYRDLGDRRGEANTLKNLGLIKNLTGDYPGATANLGQALALFRDLGDRHGEANTLDYLGLVQHMTGDYPAATTSHQQALALYRHLGDRLGEASALDYLGVVQRLTGDYSGSTASHQQALALFRDLGDRHGEASVLNYLGVVQRLTGDYSGSTASHQQALALFRDLGDRLGEAEALNELGQVLRLSGTADDARAHHSHALDIAQALGTPLEQARALEGIGHCHLQQGQVKQGGACLRQALTFYQHLGSPDAQRIETSLLTQGSPEPDLDEDPTSKAR